MLEEKIVKKLIENKETIASMESCTAGYFATTITNVDGSSEVLKFSAITYSNEYKIKMGVSSEVIDKYSVYSFETSRQMTAIWLFVGFNANSPDIMLSCTSPATNGLCILFRANDNIF